MKYCFGVDVGGTTVKIGLFHTLTKYFFLSESLYESIDRNNP